MWSKAVLTCLLVYLGTVGFPPPTLGHDGGYGPAGPHDPATVVCYWSYGSKDQDGSNPAESKIYISPNIGIAAGYQAQWVAWRFWIFNDKSRDWAVLPCVEPAGQPYQFCNSGWHIWKLIPATYSISYEFFPSFNWHFIHTSYAWWDGTAWYAVDGTRTRNYINKVLLYGYPNDSHNYYCDTRG